MFPPDASRKRRVLLIDAVAWSDAYPLSDPRRDVHGWYARWFRDEPGVVLESVPAEGDLVASLRSGLDGVIMSGSPRDAWRDDPVNDALLKAVKLCGELELPFLGVCFGHQILARALGGKVAPHPAGLELGNTPVTLTDPGKKSPLFRGFPDHFEVISSHADAVLSLPEGCELLVEGRFTENQAFHWRNQMFGVQFHPETDPGVMRFLWEPRVDKWQPKVSFDVRSTVAAMRPTPQAGEVLRNFVFHCVPYSTLT